MNDTNYIGGVIKILETPKQQIVKNNNIVVTKFRAQIPQLRNSRLVTLAFWGNLARDVLTYYKINDYLIIEGYLSLRKKTISPAKNQRSKKVEITVLKAYPFLLNYDRSIRKI
jgi:single-stranded DNA-binding protein